MGEQQCEIVVGAAGTEVVVADLRNTHHDLALVDMVARLCLAAQRQGVHVVVRPCDALRALFALAGLSALGDDDGR